MQFNKIVYDRSEVMRASTTVIIKFKKKWVNKLSLVISNFMGNYIDKTLYFLSKRYSQYIAFDFYVAIVFYANILLFPFSYRGLQDIFG